MLVFVGMTGPESIFVELQMLVRCAAENHSPQPAVADWKRFNPFLRGLLIPEREGRIGSQSRMTGYEKKQDSKWRERMAKPAMHTQFLTLLRHNSNSKRICLFAEVLCLLKLLQRIYVYSDWA